MAGPQELGEIWAVANVAGPLDVRVFVRGVTAYSASVGLNPVRLLTAGVPLSDVVIQNLSASPVDLGNDPRVAWNQGLRVPARSQWSTAGISPIGDLYGDTRTSFIFFYSGVLGPHALAARFSYTVPAGRRARVEVATALTEIVTAYAAALLTLWTYIAVFPGGGAGTAVVYGLLYARNAVADAHGTALAASIELQPGDVMQALTEDLRAGGTALHLATAKITEANA